MNAKTRLTKLGRGLNCRKKTKKTKKTVKKMKKVAFSTLVKHAKKGMIDSTFGFDATVDGALQAAKKSAEGKHIKIPRIIEVPRTHTGGIIPIIPILAALSAVGSLVGSAAGVVKTAKDIKNATAQLEENKRHNRAMELKVGNGLYLRPYSKGSGLYLSPVPKNE